MTRSFVVAAVKVVLCTFVCFILPADSVQAKSNPIYKDDDTYVELKDAKKLKGASPPFSHPYIIQEEKLRKILSSTTFRKKGAFAKKGGGKVFNSKEIETLAPLIADALSKAKANEYLYVYSPRDRVLLTNLETIFGVFVIGENMNMAFSHIQAKSRGVPNPSGIKRSSLKDPTSIKSSGFWELAQGGGQRYKKGHRNWIVIDLKEGFFDAEPIVSLAEEEEEGEYGFYDYTDPAMEDRLRRIEEQMGLISPDGSAPSIQTQPTEEPSSGEEDNMNKKFRDLKELLDNDLISPEDYKYKKKELLKRESQTKKSIPQRLKDLRNLMDEGLITERDYEKKKRELLDRL